MGGGTQSARMSSSRQQFDRLQPCLQWAEAAHRAGQASPKVRSCPIIAKYPQAGKGVCARMFILAWLIIAIPEDTLGHQKALVTNDDATI